MYVCFARLLIHPLDIYGDILCYHHQQPNDLNLTKYFFVSLTCLFNTMKIFKTNAVVCQQYFIVINPQII